MLYCTPSIINTSVYFSAMQCWLTRVLTPIIMSRLSERDLPQSERANDVWVIARSTVIRWHCVKAKQVRITKSSPTDSPRLWYRHSAVKSSSRNSKGFTPSEGVNWEWGTKDSQLSANKTVVTCKIKHLQNVLEPSTPRDYAVGVKML